MAGEMEANCIVRKVLLLRSEWHRSSLHTHLLHYGWPTRFIPAVQQWELSPAKNQCHSLTQLLALTSSVLPALTSSVLLVVPKKATNTILNWERQRWISRKEHT